MTQPINVSEFTRIANDSFFSTRDIVMDGKEAPSLGTLGRHTITASQKQVNRDTMTAFRNAIESSYGDLGVHAFDSVLGSRMAFGKSLRAKDVQAVTSLVPQMARKALENEIVLLIQTSPQYIRLDTEQCPQTLAKAIVDYAYDHDLVADNIYPKNTTGERDMSAFFQNAKACIQSGASKVIDSVLAARHGAIPELEPVKAQAEKRLIEKGFDYNVTSVEDEVRKGNIFPGMRLSNGKNPMVFVKLKDKGVEPGFIVKYDWSNEDSANMLLDVMGRLTRLTIAQHLLERPGSRATQFLSKQSWYHAGMSNSDLAEQLAAHPDAYLQIGLYTGRGANEAIPGYTNFAAIHVLKRDLAVPGDNPVKAEFRQKFPNLDPQVFADSLMDAAHPQTTADREQLLEVLSKMFQTLRDEITRPYDVNDVESSLEAFAHYAEQHIVKLDYNESDSTMTGSYRTPERTKLKQGTLYHHFRTTTTKDANVGAVSEVLANDLMVCTGIPSQELVLRQGGWSDGKPKLLLEGTMAKGYKDLDNFLKDGRLVNEDGSRLELQELGKYKIMLLLFGDRDGVGSKAQNKGCIGNQFFAIDPGHSLEGKKITFSTDFSFTADADFKNYCIFDDAPRAEKFRGVLEIRKNLVKSFAPAFGLQDHVRRNFAQYRRLADGLDESTAKEIRSRVDSMEAEFTKRVKDICDTFHSQLELYDSIAGDGSDAARVRDAEAAIEAEATLEKLASPTTCNSAKGEVQLRHLEVAPADRKPATISRDAVNGGYSISLAKVNQGEGKDIIDKLALILSKNPQHAALATHILDNAHVDANTKSIDIHLDDAQFQEFIHAFKEEDVYRLKHSAEFQTRP
ncbi:MAG: hypothetical protein IJS15_03670 [Victivallales bacterium]|nr:hypothetical protein [Victivallales bacterium]